jgi:hypothetical protein
MGKLRTQMSQSLLEYRKGYIAIYFLSYNPLKINVLSLKSGNVRRGSDCSIAAKNAVM